MDLQVDWTISIGTVVQTLAILLGGVWFVATLNSRMKNLTDRLITLERDFKQLLGALVQKGLNRDD